MKKITYQLLHGMAYAISIFPFGMLYLLADMFFILVYYIVGYRRKVVKKNLKLAFPEKSEKELNAIEKQFFHWFCDYIVETVKLMDLSTIHFTTTHLTSCLSTFVRHMVVSVYPKRISYAIW